MSGAGDLVVTIPDDHVAERRYALEMLLGEVLGLAYQLTIVAGARDYRIAVGSRTLVVRDRFFGEREERTRYLDARHVPARCGRRPHPFAAGEDIVVLYGDEELALGDETIECGLDLFASTFFMLTRWEELVSPARDEHGRMPAAASVASANGFLDRPVVNEWADLLWAMLERLGCQQPRRRRELVVTNSHDVDWPFFWTAREAFVLFAADLLKRHSPAQALRTATGFAATATRLRKDPYDTFDWLMDLSDECGVKSNFNFMTGGSSRHDPRHQLRGARLRRVLEHVDRRGHGIGFHPSYDTYDDEALWHEEWERLSDASPQPIVVGRQHVLRFDLPRTWRIWESHGMQWDSTMGFADHEGFRCGTCYDYPVFDVVARRPLAVRELPLIAMDVTLVRYRKLSPSQAWASLAALRAQVEKHGGHFMLLWHNSSLNEPEWLPFVDVYRRILASGDAPAPAIDRGASAS